jgi:uncharacterized protein (DUF952 family)
MWEASTKTGFYKPASLNSDGFIHCSTFEQTMETANNYFAGQKDLVLLCIDTNTTEAAVKYEAPAGVSDKRTDALFPHIYGSLNVSAVVRVAALMPDAQGTFALPDEQA